MQTTTQEIDAQWMGAVTDAELKAALLTMMEAPHLRWRRYLDDLAAQRTGLKEHEPILDAAHLRALETHEDRMYEALAELIIADDKN